MKAFLSVSWTSFFCETHYQAKSWPVGYRAFLEEKWINMWVISISLCNSYIWPVILNFPFKTLSFSLSDNIYQKKNMSQTFGILTGSKCTGWMHVCSLYCTLEWVTLGWFFQINLLQAGINARHTKEQEKYWSYMFIGPRSDHSLPMSVTNWLTD